MTCIQVLARCDFIQRGSVTDYQEGCYPPELKEDLADEKCMICGTRFGKHSQREFELCMGQIVKKARDYPAIKPRRDEYGKHNPQT